MTKASQPVLEVRNLTYTYEDGTQALQGVDFHLMPGESVAVLGANGSGKTTFVLHLNGLLMSDSVAVCGIPVTTRTLTAVRQKIGMVFQDADEQLFMPTVLEDVAFGPLNSGLDPNEARARAEEALRNAGLSAVAHRAPYHLSSGEKRRAAIAGVLVMQPEILVLDEPTTFLDPPSQRDLLATLRSLPQAKIVVTHDVPFARAIATRAVFFHQGAIVAEGTVDEVVARFAWETM